MVLHTLAFKEEEVMASSMAFIEREMAVMTMGCSLSYWNRFTLRWGKQYDLLFLRRFVKKQIINRWNRINNSYLEFRHKLIRVVPVEGTQVEAGLPEISDATPSEPSPVSQLARRCRLAQPDQSASSSWSLQVKVLASSEGQPREAVPGRGGVVVVTMADVHNMGSLMPGVE